MSHYKLILDDDKFREFIEWLPELQINERFYVCLFARKKYCNKVKDIKTDKSQCKRFLSKKEELYNNIRKLEVPLDSYVIKGVEIPQEALALYISVNPRDLERGTRQSLVKFAQLLSLKYNGYNPHAEVLSEIHKAPSRKIYYDFDFDGVDFEPIRDQFYEFLNKDCLTFIKTRGGFHALVELKKIKYELVNKWYQKVVKIEGCDVRGDNLIPVLGCTQGGFVPHFIK